MAAIVELLGENVIDHEGAKVPLEKYTGEGKFIGLYFASQSSPQCKGFTPSVVDFYKAIKGGSKRDKLEIIFVSEDAEEPPFKEFFATMPWLALDYADRDKKEQLAKKFKVGRLPGFIFIDGNTGALLYDDGDDKLSEDPTGDDFPW